MIDSLAKVLTYAPAVALALGATPTDRPEDLEVHPITGDVYIALTGNAESNPHGHITRLTEADSDHEALQFTWEIFAAGGEASGFSNPDNLLFDSQGNLWVMTDVFDLSNSIYQYLASNSLVMLPTTGVNKENSFLFAQAPIGAELTGPTWINQQTLVFSVQHPGGHLPEGGEAPPKSCVVIVTGQFPASRTAD